MLNKLLKSVLNQDLAPVVVCDINDIIVYMNPSAVHHYHKDLTGDNIKNCHPPKANEMIDKVVSWFGESIDNNIMYTYHNEKENKDVYMVALRDDDGTLIGYYEKHEYRNRETTRLYHPVSGVK
ncbi:MAG: PAS domain-containing protein [Clostridia bacterium]|nr:PAS domain-containing protein [Clostridia bacterium]MBQ4631278.1 PAS domain-containing protein [Clostridia bacterium]